MKFTVLLLQTTVFRLKQRRALWLWVGDKNTIYCIDVCLFPFSRSIPDLIILYFLLLAHSVVDLHPGVMETKQETKCNPAQTMIWRTRENWVAHAENKLTFDTISPLVFDICSTITCHGKGGFEIITCQSVAACTSFSPLNRSNCIKLHVPSSD